jgi:hypothetical protein
MLMKTRFLETIRKNSEQKLIESCRRGSDEDFNLGLHC